VSELQFEKAEFNAGSTAAVSTCALCTKSLVTTYFEVGGRISCPTCKVATETSFKNGSGLQGFLKALLLGTLAAVLGSALWIGIVKLTGYEIGLVAIGVGLLIGGAVRVGSGGRGGWAYQSLAVALTYTAMVAYYVPVVFQSFAEQAQADAQVDARSQAAFAGAAQEDPAGETEAEAEGEGEAEAAEQVAQPEPMAEPVTASQVALFSATVLGVAFMAPFLAGFENIMGILILGFALYEAWKMNKRSELVISGPFPVARLATATAGQEPPSSQSA